MRWIGVDRCHRASQLADENAWSPEETGIRLLRMIDLGCEPALWLGATTPKPGSGRDQTPKSTRRTSYDAAAARPAAGKVSTQPATMLPATPQRTALKRWVAPAPMIAEVIV